jgi:hypothetical protein
MRRKHLEETRLMGSSLQETISFVSDSSVWATQFIVWFSGTYAPSATARDIVEQKSMWIYHALDIAEPTCLLRRSLLALSVTRYGRVNGDVDTVRQGQRIYGSALKALQDALKQEILMLSDELFASVRALVLYEVDTLHL